MKSKILVMRFNFYVKNLKDLNIKQNNTKKPFPSASFNTKYKQSYFILLYILFIIVWNLLEI